MNRRKLMKGTFTLGAGALLGAQPAGCGEPPTPSPATSPRPATPEVNAGTSKVLLVYYSRPGENYHYGGRIDLDVGNTEVLANMITSSAAVDVYRIEAAEPYPQNYDEAVERNKREQEAEARPPITGALPTVETYDVVLLGSPIWNVRPPMIMRSFVDEVDLSGKTIHPFVTYAVSGMGSTAGDYARLCPRATIAEGLAVRGEEVREAQTDVNQWLQRIRLLA
jgi:flavodoxin